MDDSRLGGFGSMFSQKYFIILKSLQGYFGHSVVTVLIHKTHKLGDNNIIAFNSRFSERSYSLRKSLLILRYIFVTYFMDSNRNHFWGC